METLPAWIQWLVAIATALSSVGVIIAFVQLKISSNQFKKQLQLTVQQFKLLNQGYIQLIFNQLLYIVDADRNLQVAENIDDKTLYYAMALRATMQNVGNMPIKMDVKNCIVYADKKEIYRTPEAVISQTINTIYPQATTIFNFGIFNLSDKGLNIRQLSDQKITYDLLIEYHDFNDERIKTINRGMELSGAEIIVKRSDDII